MKIYQTTCQYGYAILGEKQPKLDTTAKYYIAAQSKFYPNSAIIRRTDEQSYHGNRQWIVPSHTLTEILETERTPSNDD